MSIEAMNEAWYLEKQKNPHTAFNSWCRGYEAGVKAIEQAEKQEHKSVCGKFWLTDEEIIVALEKANLPTNFSYRMAARAGANAAKEKSGG